MCYNGGMTTKPEVEHLNPHEIIARHAKASRIVRHLARVRPADATGQQVRGMAAMISDYATQGEVTALGDWFRQICPAADDVRNISVDTWLVVAARLDDVSEWLR